MVAATASHSDAADTHAPADMAAGQVAARPCAGAGPGAGAQAAASQATEQPGLQHTVQSFHEHKRQWDWEANTAKSNVIAFGAGAANLADNAPSGITWGTEQLPTAVHERYLGVQVSNDGSWVRHLRLKLGSGRHALAQWRPLLRQPDVICSAKILAVRTHVLSRLTYGLEVITPSSAAELNIVRSLDQLMRDSLYEVFGVSTGLNAWRLRRCMRSDILLLDSGCMTISDCIQAAHLRFAAKSLATRPGDAHGAGTAEGGVDRAPGKTTVLRASLPASLPWRACVDAAAADLLPGTPIAPPVAQPHTVTCTHRILQASNAEISSAVHKRRAASALAAPAPGAPPRRPRKRPRDCMDAGLAQFSLDPLAQAMSTRLTSTPAHHCAYPANVAAPFLIVRSGHVFREAYWPLDVLTTRDDALAHRMCPCCSTRFCEAGVDPTTSRWLLVWHLLTKCDHDDSILSNLERFAQVHMTFMLQAADDTPILRSALHQHAKKILAVLRLARSAAQATAANASDIQYFLAFVMNPSKVIHVSGDLRRRLYEHVACFLRGEFGLLPDPVHGLSLQPLVDSGDDIFSASEDSDQESADGESELCPEAARSSHICCSAARSISRALRLHGGRLHLHLARDGLQQSPPVPPTACGREADASLGRA